MAFYSLVKATQKLLPNMQSLGEEVLSAQVSIQKLATISGFGVLASEMQTPAETRALVLELGQACFNYGYIGELGSAPSAEQLRNLVALTIAARACESLFPAQGAAIQAEGGQLEKALFLTYARNKIDAANGLACESYAKLDQFFDESDSKYLSFYELSMLADMSDMAVRNATRSQGKDYLKITKCNGRTVVESPIAADWLADRNGYRPTKPDIEASPIDSDLEHQELVIVPFAADGTFFPQNCARKGHYRIGPKGDEHSYGDKYAALAKLREMHKARWRRPNSNGIPGIVTAREWKSISRAEFERH